MLKQVVVGLTLTVGFLSSSLSNVLAQDSYRELAFRVQRLQDPQASAALETLKNKGVFAAELAGSQADWVPPRDLELTYRGNRPLGLVELALLTHPIVLAQMKTARVGADCPMRLVALEESRFESADPGRPLFGSRFKFKFEGETRSGEGREGAFEIWLESPLKDSTGRGVDKQSELILASTKISLVAPFKAQAAARNADR